MNNNKKKIIEGGRGRGGGRVYVNKEVKFL